MIVLASNSPRRRQLLALGGWKFEIKPAELDESVLLDETPAAYVRRLAEQKTLAIAEKLHPGNLVVAADTTVVHENEILGKPANAQEAASILRRLRGRRHEVYTGLAVLRLSDAALRSEVCVTKVFMRNFTEAEIQAYIATGDPLDKAGAYAIQHTGFDPVDRIEGCYANVVGLPLCGLTRLLHELGSEPPTDRLKKYLTRPDQPCVISEQIMIMERHR
jgi:MAF protein